MSSFQITSNEADGIMIFAVKGYFAQEGGDDLKKQTNPLMKSGKLSFIFDFSECTMMSSPGVASIMDLCFCILDDYKGRVCLSGLDQLKTKVLTLAGVLPVVDAFPTIEAAKNRLK